MDDRLRKIIRISLDMRAPKGERDNAAAAARRICEADGVDYLEALAEVRRGFAAVDNRVNAMSISQEHSPTFQQQLVFMLLNEFLGCKVNGFEGTPYRIVFVVPKPAAPEPAFQIYEQIVSFMDDAWKAATELPLSAVGDKLSFLTGLFAGLRENFSTQAVTSGAKNMMPPSFAEMAEQCDALPPPAFEFDPPKPDALMRLPKAVQSRKKKPLKTKPQPKPAQNAAERPSAIDILSYAAGMMRGRNAKIKLYGQADGKRHRSRKP